jgi:hypothetical protein
LTRLGLISFLILAGLDYLLRHLYQPITQVTVLSLGIAFCFSLFFWSFIDLVKKGLPIKYGKFWASLVALLWVFLLGTQATAFMRFGEYATPFMVNWVIRDPAYIVDYLWIAINIPYLLLIVLCWTFFYWLWAPRNALLPQFTLEDPTESVNGKRAKILDQRPKSRSYWIHLVASLLMTMVSLNQLRRETLGQLRLADGALAVSIDSVIKQTSSGGYHFSERERLKKMEGDKNLPNVFLFIGESWSKTMVPTYGWDKTETMPFLKQFIKDENALVFSSAYTNSGATDVSIPSLFSGVGPEESIDKLHRLPLIWDWARAAGYQTIFISPQRLAFNGIHQFFQSPGPDLFIPGDAIDFRMVNDSGIDDLKAVEFLRQKLVELRVSSKDRNAPPLFIVFFHNALHFPFLTESPGLEIPTFETRYEKALYITDQVLKELVQVLEDQQLWNNTLFWATADHGEVEFSKNKVPRIASFYEEILGIPFFVRWPSQFPERNVWRQCRDRMNSHLQQNVQNLDILPTLLDLWGIGQENSKVASSLRGRSLCSEIDPERLIIHLNTNKVRQWSPEGFAITKGTHRYSFTNIEGAKFFDLTPAKHGTTEVLNSETDQAAIEPFLKVVESENLLKELWNRYQHRQ